MRIAVITDIHEDIEALERAISKIDRVGHDTIVCLGDISGFSVPYYDHHDKRDAHGSLALLREKCSLIIAGNHDLHSAGVVPPPLSGYAFPPDWYHLDLFERRDISNGEVWLYDDELPSWYTAKDREYIASLPLEATMDVDCCRIYFSHYIFPNLSGVLRGGIADSGGCDAHFNRMKEKRCNVSIVGHMHPRKVTIISEEGKENYVRYGAAYEIGDQHIIVMAPPVTGPRAGFLTVDTETGTIKATRI